LDATVRVRFAGRPLAVAVQKAAASMKIAAQKTSRPRRLRVRPGGAQKARVNSAAKPPGNARKWIKNMTFSSVQVIIEIQTI
jgi:hypothetical protein